MKKLFLDDVRNPEDCSHYMHTRTGSKNLLYLEKDWIIVRNFNDFCKAIEEKELPEYISFDHDLAEEHYLYDEMDAPQEKYEFPTGYDCLDFLLGYCFKKDIDIPTCVFHTMNPVGRDRMEQYYKQAKSIKGQD